MLRQNDTKVFVVTKILDNIILCKFGSYHHKWFQSYVGGASRPPRFQKKN